MCNGFVQNNKECATNSNIEVIHMKYKWNKWLSDVDEVIEVCIRDMQEIAPSHKRGASYELIARQWFTQMPLHAYALSHFDTSEGYQIQLSEMRNKFNYRYKRKHYWYKWFEKNYPIYSVLQKGNEYKGNTKVMIHPDHDMVMKLATPEEIGKVYETDVDPLQEVDWIDIDLDNLQRFLLVSEYNVEKKKHVGKNYIRKIKNNITQARGIIKLAQYYDHSVVDNLTGDVRYKIPQPYKISPFGRKYYTGAFALQNKSSELRAACMGRCWSVDIDSSVFRFYKMLAKIYNVEHSTLDILLADKGSFRNELAMCLQNVSTDTDYLVKLVKQAITALGFGARDTSYWDPATKKQSAIAEIIKNKDDRDRLTSHPYWCDLKRIYNEIKTHIKKDPDIVDPYKTDPQYWVKNKYTIDRLMSLLYQRYEAQIMERTIELLTDAQRQPKLWVHDGVYTLLHPMKKGEMQAIEMILREEMNPYVKFEITEHEEYRVQFTEEIKKEETEHERNISAEEMLAAQWAYDNQFMNQDQLTPEERLAALRMRNPEYVENSSGESGETPGGHYNGTGPDPEYIQEYYATVEKENNND